MCPSSGFCGLNTADSIGEDLLGVCYGELGQDLPPISTTIKLLKELHADAVRLYDANPSVLTALRGTGIGVIVSVLDSELQDFAQNPTTAGECFEIAIILQTGSFMTFRICSCTHL